MDMHPVCMDYINYVALYEPERMPLDDLVLTLWEADADVISECAVLKNDGLKRVARERGVPVAKVRKEFRELSKRLPTSTDIRKSKTTQEALDFVTQAHAQMLGTTPEGRRLIAQRQRRGQPIV